MDKKAGSPLSGGSSANDGKDAKGVEFNTTGRKDSDGNEPSDRHEQQAKTDLK